MDIGLIGGLIAAFGVIYFGIAGGGSSVSDFIDTASLIIVIGGTFTTLFVAFPMQQVLSIGKVLGVAVKMPKTNAVAIIKKIIELANIARKDGLLAIEEAASNIDDEFMKKGVMLIVDGTDPELVKSILEADMGYASDRHAGGKALFDFFATIAPSFGLIGTILGLVAMLNNMSDPSSIGPSMAIALITTFYGAIIANAVCMPISAKLTSRDADEMFIKEIISEGLLSIQAGENPRVIEEKLKAFLSPVERKSMTQATEEKK